MTLDTIISIVETAMLCVCTYILVLLGLARYWKTRDLDNTAWLVVDVFLMVTVNQQFYQQLTNPNILSSSSAVRGAILLYFISGFISRWKAHALRRASQ